MELIFSFSDDIEVSSGQLKRFSESAVDPKCLLKVEVNPFVLIIIYPFQATYSFVYYVFLGACLSKIETRLFSKAVYVHSRHTITNIQFKLFLSYDDDH